MVDLACFSGSLFLSRSFVANTGAARNWLTDWILMDVPQSSVRRLSILSRILNQFFFVGLHEVLVNLTFHLYHASISITFGIT